MVSCQQQLVVVRVGGWQRSLGRVWNSKRPGSRSSSSSIVLPAHLLHDALGVDDEEPTERDADVLDQHA